MNTKKVMSLSIKAACCLAVTVPALPSKAQVYDASALAKVDDKKILATLRDVDKRTVDKTDVFSIDTVTGPKKFSRVWQTGFLDFTPALKADYGCASADERVAFALDYEQWLRECGESSSVNRFVPYSHRVSFANKWWTIHSVSKYRTESPVWWVRESLLDAGFLISSVAKDLHLADAEKNAEELKAVYAESNQAYPLQVPNKTEDGRHHSFVENLAAVERESLAGSYQLGETQVKRVWKSNYGGVSKDDREKFIVAYNNWLNNPKNKSDAGSFLKRVTWAEQWWTDHCPSYINQPYYADFSGDPLRNWARDSVVDADLLTNFAMSRAGRIPQGDVLKDQRVPAAAASSAAADAANDSHVPEALNWLAWYWNEKAQFVSPGPLCFPGSPVTVWNSLMEQKVVRVVFLGIVLVLLPFLVWRLIKNRPALKRKRPVKTSEV